MESKKKNRKYLLLIPILALVFFFIWNKQYHLNMNPYSGKAYKIVMHCNDKRIPANHNQIHVSQLYAWDSISIRNKEGIVTDIGKWEVVVVESKTNHFKAIMQNNAVPDNFFSELKKMDKPGAIFIKVMDWPTKEQFPEVEPRRVDIISQ